MEKMVDGKMVPVPAEEVMRIEADRAEYNAGRLTRWRETAFLHRKQWALISAENGWITETEALAWVGGTAIPAWVDRVIDTHIPAEQQLKTKLAVLDGQVIYRSGGLMPFLQAEQGVTDEQLDAYFGWTD